MRTLGVIEAHEFGQTPGERRPAGEVPAAKLHPPVFLENGALQPLDEPVGPGMPRLGARVPNAQGVTGVIEGPLELAAAVREHPLQGPAGASIERHEGLARHVDVTVLVPSRSRRRIEERRDRVRVIRVPEFGRYFSAPLCPTMRAELRRLAPNLVHLQFPNPTGDLAYLLSSCRAPVVMTYHADVIRRSFLLWPYWPVFRLLAAHIRRVIVTSREYLDSSTFLAPHRDRCLVVTFGVDLDGVALRIGEVDQVQELRRRHGERIILFLGALRYYRGLDVLVRAMARMTGGLLVAGQGPKRAALETLTRELGLTDRITFLGEVSESQRRLLLHACDVFVLPSTDRSEAFGIAQLEAMACGKPVVSSDLPTGVRLVNQDGVTGMLVPPGDPDALGGALNGLLEDDQPRVGLGKAARLRVEQEFTAERMIARTLGVYDEVLA
jgi:rhamnosyl/mannosyltransferase